MTFLHHWKKNQGYSHTFESNLPVTSGELLGCSHEEEMMAASSQPAAGRISSERFWMRWASSFVNYDSAGPNVLLQLCYRNMLFCSADKFNCGALCKDQISIWHPQCPLKFLPLVSGSPWYKPLSIHFTVNTLVLNLRLTPMLSRDSLLHCGFNCCHCTWRSIIKWPWTKKSASRFNPS